MAKTSKTAATVTVFQPARMTPKGRKAIALWLRRTATTLERLGPKMDTRWTARYLY